MTAADLIDHADTDAKLLAARAVEELPDATALLVLADRLAELVQPDRERLARRLAAGLVGPVEPVRGCGPCTIGAIMDYLAPDLADVAACLGILTAPVPEIRPASRLTLLAALKMSRPMRPAELHKLDPVSRDPRHRAPLDGRGRLHQAAGALLCRPPTLKHDPLAMFAVRNVEAAEWLLTNHHENRDLAAKHARWRVGWCCAIAAALPPVELMRNARRHAYDLRRKRLALHRGQTLHFA